MADYNLGISLLNNVLLNTRNAELCYKECVKKVKVSTLKDMLARRLSEIEDNIMELEDLIYSLGSNPNFKINNPEVLSLDTENIKDLSLCDYLKYVEDLVIKVCTFATYKNLAPIINLTILNQLNNAKNYRNQLERYAV